MTEIIIILLGLCFAFVFNRMTNHHKKTKPIKTTSSRSIHAPDRPAEAIGNAILSEKSIKIRHPIAISGRLDQAWETADGIVISDTKTRNKNKDHYKWTQSEQLQLSLYAMLLRHSDIDLSGKSILNYGLIRLEPVLIGENSHYIKVPLLPEQEVIARYRRYWALYDNQAVPTRTDNRGACAVCGHAERCPQRHT